MLKYLMLVVLCATTLNLIAQDFSGRIINDRDKSPVPYAKIYITSIQSGVVADSNGVFSFDISLPDVIEVKISAEYYTSLIVSVRQGSDQLFELDPYHIDFDDIVVSAPTGGLNSENSVKIDKLQMKDLRSLQASSLTEAIANINGVQEASFGAGISKPVIRGMQGVRLLTMVNGLRIENQQWGNDHGMAVNQLGVGAVEVIKGPSSLLYGADAFGGVLYLVDEPYTNQNTFEIYTDNRYESVNQGAVGTMGFKLTKGNVRFAAHGLYSEFSDYQVPEGEFAFNSRYGVKGFKTSFGFNKKNWVSHLRYTYSDAIAGLPGHGGHEEDEEEEDHDGHEEIHSDLQRRGRLTPSIRGENHIFSFENKFFKGKDEWSVLLGHTINNTFEYEESFNEAALDINLMNSLYQVRYKKVLNDHWNLSTGLQGMYQVNKNDPEAEEQLIPNFEQSDNGAYVLASMKKDKWSAQFGARYDLRILNAKGAGYENQFGSPNFSAGFVNSDKKRTYRINIATGFRAPHISELLADGEHAGALRYEVGNVDLKSEKSAQIDASYEFHREHLELIFNPFYNLVQDYIYLSDRDSVIDNLPLYQYEQSGLGNLYGVDFGIHYHPHFAHWLHLESSYSYIRGSDLKGNSYSLMPQARLNTFLKVKFNMTSKFTINEIALQHQFYFAQNDVDVFETSSRDYQIINFGMDMTWRIKTPIHIGVGVKNILNQYYINHLSRMKNVGLESPGRNIYINLRYEIKGKLK